MNWKYIIREIQRLGGMTQPEIAKHVGCGQATISGLCNGATQQPRYQLGAELLDLLERVKKANVV